MYVAYIAILEHQISAKDITSDYGFLLRSVKTFAVDTEEYQYPRCTKVNDAKTFKSLVVSFYTLFSQIICMHFAYQPIDLVLYIMRSDKKDTKLYLLVLLHLQRANKLKIKPANIQSRSPRTLIKRKPADMELSIYLKP